MSSQQHDLSEFIIAQLNAQGVRIRSSRSKDIQAYCFRGHDHKSASLSIRKSDGAFICFGCGVKGRNWNAIKQFLPGVEVVAEQDLPDEAAVVAERIRGQLRRSILDMKLPWDVEPWVGPYRHVQQYTLDAIRACRWFDGLSRCFRILFPVYIGGELRGWVARRLDEEKEQKYRNAPNFPAKENLFPFDVVAEMRPSAVVLVEGPYDALRLVNLNIPALCIFGTRNYAPVKKGLLARLGVDRVVLALDNDQAGREVRLDIAMDLRTVFDVQHFHPPEGKDPGNMARTAVDQLTKILAY